MVLSSLRGGIASQRESLISGLFSFYLIAPRERSDDLRASTCNFLSGQHVGEWCGTLTLNYSRKRDGKKKKEEGRGKCGKRYRTIHATEHLPQHPRRICEKQHPDKNARLLARQPAKGPPVLVHIFRIIESSAPVMQRSTLIRNFLYDALNVS